MGEIINVHKILVRKAKEREHLRDLCIDGKIALKLVLRKLRIAFFWPEERSSECLPEHGVEPSAFVRNRKFINHLKDCQRNYFSNKW
jgi:hypothetical protein